MYMEKEKKDNDKKRSHKKGGELLQSIITTKIIRVQLKNRNNKYNNKNNNMYFAICYTVEQMRANCKREFQKLVKEKS